MDRLRSPAISKACIASSSPKTPVNSGVRSTRRWLDQVDRQAELLVEAKGPAHFDFLGHHHVLRNRDVAAEPELNQDAAWLEHLEPGANRPFVAGRFELDVEIAFVRRISAELIGVISD